MKPHMPQARSKISMGSQVAAVLIVLLAVFALPCCPRVDGMFVSAVAAAEAQEQAVTIASYGHHHHHGAMADDGSHDSHKGHLMATGAVDVLPFQGHGALMVFLPLLVLTLSRLLSIVASPSLRIPVPPPRTVVV